LGAFRRPWAPLKKQNRSLLKIKKKSRPRAAAAAAARASASGEMEDGFSMATRHNT